LPGPVFADRQQRRFGFHHRRVRQPAFAVDEGAIPHQVLTAGDGGDAGGDVGRRLLCQLRAGVGRMRGHRDQQQEGQQQPCTHRMILGVGGPYLRIMPHVQDSVSSRGMKVWERSAGMRA